LSGGGNIKSTKIFNLLVTFKGHKSETVGVELLGIEEIELALQNEDPVYTEETEFINVVLVQVATDPLDAAMKLMDTQTTVISKIVPINEVVRTRQDYIVEKVIMLAGEKTKPKESFVVRCDLRGRKYIKSGEELIGTVSDELIEKLNLKLNEKNPDWVVQIEVVGEDTGVSVLRPGEIFKKI